MRSFHRSLLLLAASCIYVMGLVMIFNTTSAELVDLGLETGSHQALLRQILYGVVGCWLATGMWLLGYRPLLRLSPWLLGLTTLALLLVFVPGIGRSANGSYRWVGFGSLALQPSEFAKFVLPAYFIYAIAPEGGANLPFRRFVQLGCLLAVPLLLILRAPDHGSVGVIGASLAMLCFLMQVPWRYWALPLLACIIAGGFIAVYTPYVRARINVYLNPELDLLGKGHQPYQAKIAAGSGQLLGKGPGNSWQKLSYLPEAQNDYIAAIYAEEYGFLGVLVLLALYMTVAYVGGMIAIRAPDREACFLAMTITFLFSFQAFLNLGVVSGLLPSTGLNLPLFSQGGSSLIANFLGFGVLLSILDATRPVSVQSPIV